MKKKPELITGESEILGKKMVDEEVDRLTMKEAEKNAYLIFKNDTTVRVFCRACLSLSLLAYRNDCLASAKAWRDAATQIAMNWQDIKSNQKPQGLPARSS